MKKPPIYTALAPCGRTALACCFTICLLLAACSGAQTASPPAGSQPGASYGLPPARDLPPAGGAPAPADKAAPAQDSISNLAPAWQPLARRLAEDGFSGPQVEALLATLDPTPTQSPMGRKMRELYMRKFFPPPPRAKTAPPKYYKGVVEEANARLCRDFIAANDQAFANADARYSVPPAIAAALLFVETRLGRILADVSENAFYTLASMAVSRQPADIPDWLARMPEYEKRLDWFAEIMPKRADWAYKEVRALVRHLLHDNLDPGHLPGSIYGAVGLCQFMPSNIATYGADGDGDNKVDLFTIPDAVASLANYLARHGWKAGLPREQQHALLMKYNHAAIYANTILALADLVEGRAVEPQPAAATPSGKKAGGKASSGKKAAGKKTSGKAAPAPAKSSP